MNMEHAEYLKLQGQLQDHFDGRYRKLKDCEKTVETLEKNQNTDNTRLAVIEQQNKLILAVLGAVSTGIITMLLKMFFGG